MNEPPAASPVAPIPEVTAGNQIAWLEVPRKWWVLAVAVPSVVLAEVAFTVLIFSNLQVLQGIDTDAYGYQLATGPYLVCLVVGALLSVRFAQTFGSQRTYLAGAIMTGVGCLVASAAESLFAMVMGRLLMSGKVLVLAVTLSQMWLAFPRRKSFSMAIYNAAMYGGLFVGAALGGFLEFQASWRAIYFVSGVLFLLLAVAGHRILIHDRPTNPPPLVLNAPEVTLLGTGLAALMFLVFRGQYYGWLDSNLVALAIPIAAFALAGFVWSSLRKPDPLVNLRLAEFPTLALTLGVIGVFGGAVIGMLNTLPAYLNLRGYPSDVEGWILLVPGLVMVVSCLATGFVYGRARTVVTLWAGLVLTLIGSVWFVGADLYTSKGTILANLCVWAAGVGLVLPIALRLTLAGQVPAAVQRLAGVKVALRFTGTVVGAFAAALIVQRGTDTGQDFLRQAITADNPAYRQMVTRLEQHAIAHGSHPAVATRQAASVVGHWVSNHAQLMGMQAGRRYLVMLTAIALLIALFIRLRPEVSILADDLRDLVWAVRRHERPHVKVQPGPSA